MIATHTMKVNGAYYRAGEEVKEVVKAAAEKVAANIIAEPKIEPVSDTKYTKTEINRLSTAELQELATKEGIANATETSGAELKKILIKHFGL